MYEEAGGEWRSQDFRGLDNFPGKLADSGDANPAFSASDRHIGVSVWANTI